jgi:hypothetical protein
MMELIRGKKPLNKSLLKTGRSVSDICKILGYWPDNVLPVCEAGRKRRVTPNALDFITDSTLQRR